MKLLLVLLAAVVEHIATTARGFLSRSTVLSMRRFADCHVCVRSLYARSGVDPICSWSLANDSSQSRRRQAA